MTPVEAAAAMEKETAEWEQEVTEVYGLDYLDLVFDEED
jgi:hypothetical protein